MIYPFFIQQFSYSLLLAWLFTLEYVKKREYQKVKDIKGNGQREAEIRYARKEVLLKQTYGPQFKIPFSRPALRFIDEKLILFVDALANFAPRSSATSAPPLFQPSSSVSKLCFLLLSLLLLLLLSNTLANGGLFHLRVPSHNLRLAWLTSAA